MNENENEKDINKEDMEISENSENKELEQGKLKISTFTVFDKVKFVLYILFIAYTLFLQYVINPSLNITLGDFGSILTVLLLVIGINGFKWLPYISGVGLVLLVFKKIFSEIEKAYFIIVCFLVVISTILMFMI